jgi:hypothetical protein
MPLLDADTQAYPLNGTRNSAKFYLLHFRKQTITPPHPSYYYVKKLITVYKKEVFIMFKSSRVRSGLQTLLMPALFALAISSLSFVSNAQQPVQEQQPVAPAAAATPLYKEYKGVRLGMNADEVRQKLGKPEETGKEQDLFVFSDTERARVYYDTAQKATAIISTFIGKASNAPTPEAVLGTAIEAKPDGTSYKLVQYPEAGYWVAYSRTAGDEPFTIITMQAMPASAKK